MKKAQSISINTIVIAVIALMVLIILVFIVGRQSGLFVTQANSCETVGGECDDAFRDSKDSNKCIEDYARVPGAECEDGGICCKRIIPEIGNSE